MAASPSALQTLAYEPPDVGTAREDRDVVLMAGLCVLTQIVTLLLEYVSMLWSFFGGQPNVLLCAVQRMVANRAGHASAAGPVLAL